jgi:hypothetical protein
MRYFLDPGTLRIFHVEAQPFDYHLLLKPAKSTGANNIKKHLLTRMLSEKTIFNHDRSSTRNYLAIKFAVNFHATPPGGVFNLMGQREKVTISKTCEIPSTR